MRTSGILMPIFSLSSKHGIGTFGDKAYEFVDFLNKAGQTYWQILPIGVTSFGDSPYQSFSSYAGNPYFIDLEYLQKDGLLEKKEIDELFWGENPDRIDYEALYKNRYKILHIAYGRFIENIPDDFYSFEKENGYWLCDYALFSVIKDYNGGKPFSDWQKGLKYREQDALDTIKESLASEILFYKVIQYFFFKQWFELKEYANKKGVYIIGDIPIYVALDSADVWSRPQQFLLDEKLAPKAVAGCPPDAFSTDGQLWGNPLYDWDYMKKDGYKWWIERIGFSAKLYDVVRIDHFRGFSAFFKIPYGQTTAKNGEWVKGPSKDLFKAINEKLGKLNIIAEDLGTIDDDVRELLSFTGYPGMKVLQFAFSPDSESSYLPHNVIKNCVLYTGTHDNDTAVGFMNDGSENEVKFMREYLRISPDDSFNWALIKSAMATSADTVILQMQDFLGLDNTARINTPSTLGENWKWRIADGCVNDWLAKIIYNTTATYFRLPEKAVD